MKPVKQLILEVFDKPWAKEHDEEFTNSAKEVIKDRGGDDKFLRVCGYKLEGDNGYLLSYIRNGSFEAHHLNKDFHSGKFVPAQHSNPRFVSTMADHIKTEGLDKGMSAKIMAPINSPLHKHYKKFVTHFAKKHNLKTSEDVEQSLGNMHHSITIHPAGSRSMNEDGWV